MPKLASELPKKVLPERIRRDLRKGETIWHSTSACHVSKKYPEGKWMAQTRREEKGRLVKYPIKGFGTPKDALDYLITLRPNEKGRVTATVAGEPTVTDLYEFVIAHRQKRLSERTRAEKASRWEKYIKPEWGFCPLSQVTKRSAQVWITEVEAKIAAEDEDAPGGLSQFNKVRTDLHALFECLGSFSHHYEDRKNPFSGLDFVTPPPRHKVTIESQHFPAVHSVCLRYAATGFCTDWVAEQFLTSLLSGLRHGEVYALCEDQLDFEQGAIIVDRSMRRNSRAIDFRTRLETGEVLRMAMSYPKGGSATLDKTRVVPMSDQLKELLQRVVKRKREAMGDWKLLWPSENGKFRELTRFTTAWETLRTRLHDLARFAPIERKEEGWPKVETKRGRTLDPLITEARQNPEIRLPNVFEAIDFRDTRNSFASYMNELGLSQATREHILGHGGGLTNTVYTEITSNAFQQARQLLSSGWQVLS